MERLVIKSKAEAQKMSRRMERKYMSEHKPDIKAIRKFRTPAYEAAKLIRVQGEQIEKKNK